MRSFTCPHVPSGVRTGTLQTATGLNFKSSTRGVEDYLNTHQLEARIQSLFETVLKKQPSDPYRCMIEELQKIKRAGDESIADALAQSDLPKAPMAPAEPPPKNARPSPAGKGRNRKLGEAERVSQADIDTKAALAEVMKQDYTQQSSSLSNIRLASRPDAVKARSNLELAHEVMRLVIRQIVAKLAAQSSSLGAVRDESRHRAIEHAKNRIISHHVLAMVMRDASVRLQARSLGLVANTTSDHVIYRRDSARCAENKALTLSVVRSSFRKAL